MSQTFEQHSALTIQLCAETRQKLRDRAVKAGMSLESFIEGLAERESKTEVDGPSDAIAKSITRIQNRTPEQVLADRERILSLTPDPLDFLSGGTRGR